MIIDFHVHLFPPEIILHRNRFFDDVRFYELYRSEKSAMVDRAGLCDMMRVEGIDRAVAMAFPFQNETYRELQNEYLIASSRESAGKIIPFLAPIENLKGLKEWAKSAKKSGAAGIGEVAFYAAGFGEEEMKYVDALLQVASMVNLPVCLHVNEPVGHHYVGKYTTSFELLYEVIARNSKTTIILAHWGGGIFFYELMKEVREAFSHVWYDTAATPYVYDEKIYEIASQIIGAKKILFGSDYPLLSPSRYVYAMRKYLGDDDIKMVLAENARKLLGIS